MLIGSSVIGEIRADNFINGIPNFFNYIFNTFPKIRPTTFFSDIAEWYWGIKRWSLMLLDTLIIAFLGTLFGFIFAFINSFLASRNLMKNKLVYNLIRRV
jgi:phosphonate transport system permease protein